MEDFFMFSYTNSDEECQISTQDRISKQTEHK